MHAAIEYREPGNESPWRLFGNYRSTEDEITELRELLEGFDDPYVALTTLPAGLFCDTLKILKSDGCEARVIFLKDH